MRETSNLLWLISFEVLILLIFSYNMTNILSWNCRGASARYFPRSMRELKNNHQIQILIIIEPRISGSKADKVISNLGFGESFRVECWIISASSQLIHSNVSFRNGDENFFLTCVHGSPTPSIRQGLWSQLEDIHSEASNAKWVCIGDFNSYKATEDKQGGARPNFRSMNDFNN